MPTCQRCGRRTSPSDQIWCAQCHGWFRSFVNTGSDDPSGTAPPDPDASDRLGRRRGRRRRPTLRDDTVYIYVGDTLTRRRVVAVVHSPSTDVTCGKTPRRR